MRSGRTRYKESDDMRSLRLTQARDLKILSLNYLLATRPFCRARIQPSIADESVCCLLVQNSSVDFMEIRRFLAFSTYSYGKNDKINKYIKEFVFDY